MYYTKFLDLFIVFGYSINFFATLALGALIFCLIKVEQKRLSMFCYVLKFEIALNLWFSTILFILQPYVFFPHMAAISMNPICSLVPFCATIHLSLLIFLLFHFIIFFIVSTIFQLSRVRLTLNELLDLHKIYVCNQHRKLCFFLIIGIFELIAFMSFICLIIFGSQSRFDTATLLNANGLAPFIPRQPYSFNSSIPAYITFGFIACFVGFTILGIFSMLRRVSGTLTEFRVVGSPGLHYQCKLLRILYVQLILVNVLLFIPLLLSLVFLLIQWEFSSLFASGLLLLLSFYPLASNLAILIVTPHFWEKIRLTFKPFYCCCYFCSLSMGAPTSQSSIASSTNSLGFFGIYPCHPHPHPHPQQLYRY